MAMRTDFRFPLLTLILLSNALCALAQPWVSRHGLSPAQYQAEFNKWTKEGYRLTQVSGYSDGGQDRYTAIFEKKSGPAWAARHGLTGAQYQSEFDKLTKDGFRPVLVSGFASGNQAKYAAIFVKEAGAPAWSARHGLTGAQYQAEFDKMTKEGFKLADISAYTVAGQDRYAAIFEKKTGMPSWSARHGMTSAAYQTEFDKMADQGYRLVKVSGYSAGNQPRFAALWEKSNGPAWQARHGLSGGQGYQDEFDRMYYQGYRPVWVNGYTVSNKDHYAAIWTCSDPFKAADMKKVDDLVKKYMDDYDVPGLSFAISRDGKLALAKTYGYADKEGGERVAPRHRFRVASVSKPITATAIMRMVQNNAINLSDKVFGSGALLGTTYGSDPYSADVKKITVEHLLTHTAGGWGNSSNDPMFQDKSWSMTKLIGTTLDNNALQNSPGSDYAYSNFGFCLLGRIIEKKSGKTYESWVKDNILSKSGIANMEISGNTLAQRKKNEVKYYGPGDPYAYNIARMDAHGGWLANPVDLVRFTVRVDRFNTVPDLLSNDMLAEMYQPTAASGNDYAKGWSVNSTPNYWHNGSLPGTLAIMVRTEGGFCWAVLINSRPSDSAASGKLDALMWDIRNAISDWPEHDLF
jgi:CubicO group peptidase (beta-lactamase class C family)